ncbi:Iron-sulfur cluster-binding domain-containing protein [Rhodoblastus acidophilus]|uniref:Iron-sulfur cluster-binding domain-containing protein n=1 Tax=Rhodoblastus acidophilus TaxID=1074 RepID=A0A212RET6_RHOAC|nr:radical SAM/SPASM domain-containing protein [Rhodoblastus acidophilus]PPQ39732.1 hypothetical protein CKO16_05760 [Rhodoblastus acidophilus]RAI16529.1 hypothetical protein CH337_20885 [Rhodoblastus acidophilus]SNB70707.1 Iron-sulfur cluster-binding domain-containing protein [Rhodoblastus acidophilus]
MATMEITTMAGCPLMCTFCPQDELKAAYGKLKDKYMSLETFQTLLEKIPAHVRIDFSGMAEPWANPRATDMVRAALERGRRVAIYTTLYGISVEDSALLTQDLLPRFAAQIEVVCLHLPDESGNMRGYKGSDSYRAVLKNFLDLPNNGFPAKTLNIMTMDGSGRVHPDLRDLVPGLGKWTGHSRAGSLGEAQGERVGASATPRNGFALACASTPFYDHNVVLPNGDVVLCCMDYGLQHVIGNLLDSGYYDLFAAPELNRLRVENQKPGFSACSICKSCDNVVNADAPEAREIKFRDVRRYFGRKISALFGRA